MIVRAGIIFLFCFPVFLSANAQKNVAIVSTWCQDIQIDGKLLEWGDSLSFYFKDQDLHYSFANDDEYLYVAIRVKNNDRQVQAAFNGFNITINTDGKKKEGPILIFPLPDRSALRALSNQEFSQATDIRKGALSTIRAFYVKNFPNILNGPISLENNYGIRASVQIDSADNLCYEGAIRLDQLKLQPKQDSFAVNVKINGIVKTQYTSHDPMRNNRRNPYHYGIYNPYDNRTRTIIQNKEEPGIWQIVRLAEKPH